MHGVNGETGARKARTTRSGRCLLRAHSARTARSGRYLLHTLMTATVTLVAAPLLCMPSLATPWAEHHRRRAGDFLDRPPQPRPRALRRDLAWLAIQVATGLPAGALALLCLGNLLVTLVVTVAWPAFPASDPPRLLLLGSPIDGWAPALTLNLAQFLLLAALAAIALPLLARAHARCCLAVLAPSPTQRLAARVTELTRTRTDVLQAHGAELRRIERDLHDGTQARLVGLAMHLTLIHELVTADADRGRVLAAVDTARSNATQAIADLRHLVKGIHPPVLDEGLPAALATLAADSPLSVDVSTDIRARPTPAVESIAYFCAAELLANATKHSGADTATVTVTAHDGPLRLRVADDGRGGAVIGAGSGLTGLLARVRTVDGTLTCDSPPGGPTVVTVELPRA